MRGRREGGREGERAYLAADGGDGVEQHERRTVGVLKVDLRGGGEGGREGGHGVPQRPIRSSSHGNDRREGGREGGKVRTRKGRKTPL